MSKVFQWALSMCHGFVCLHVDARIRKDVGGRMLDDGTFYDISQVCIPYLQQKSLCPKFVLVYNHLVP